MHHGDLVLCFCCILFSHWCSCSQCQISFPFVPPSHLSVSHSLSQQDNSPMNQHLPYKLSPEEMPLEEFPSGANEDWNLGKLIALVEPEFLPIPGHVYIQQGKLPQLEIFSRGKGKACHLVERWFP